MEWQALDKNPDFQTRSQKYQLKQPFLANWRRWFPILVGLLLALLIVLGSTFLWYSKQQEARLLADLKEVIVGEARTQVLGMMRPDIAVQQYTQFVDPSASRPWQRRYRALYQLGPMPPALFPGTWHPPTVIPNVKLVEFTAGRQQALVEVDWTQRSHVVERRAYRLVSGRWQRTPLPDKDRHPCAKTTEVQKQLTEHFIINTCPKDIATLTDDPALKIEYESLYTHIHSTWPAELVQDTSITFTSVPLELQTPFIVASGDEGKIISVSPALAHTNAKIPLLPKVQYRVALTYGVVDALTRQTPRQAFDVESDVSNAIWMLQQVQARWWSLDPTQRKIYRNALREELNRRWRSPFVEPGLNETEEELGMQETKNWLISWQLFIEQLLVQGYINTPGEIAQELLDRPGIEAYAELMECSPAELEARARDFALTPEP